MSATQDAKSEFLGHVAAALEEQNFLRVSLGKYRGTGDDRKAVLSPVMLKGEPRLQLVTRLPRSDDTRNFDATTAIATLGAMIGGDYKSATLFTSGADVALDYSRKGEARISKRKPSLKAETSAAAAPAHDRAKQYLVTPDRPYLKGLGISDAEGRIKPSMQGKYRQICHFIAIVDDLLNESAFDQALPLTVLDIGSGKGYLTFALYDHLQHARGFRCAMTGIERREDLVALCNRLAREFGFSTLSFRQTDAGALVADPADIVVALHACDTATDDAMALGVEANARLVLCAPCCQHELAPQIQAGDLAIAGLAKFGLFKQRLADIVTDAARALLLEAAGYKVKVIEFVAIEHTAKNVLIAAIKTTNARSRASFAQYEQLKDVFGFSTQRLAELLRNRVAP